MSAYPVSHDYAEQSMHRTHRWLDRCYDRWKQTAHPQNTNHFSNSTRKRLSRFKKKSAEYAASLDCDGIAIGGVSVENPVRKCIQLLLFVAMCCRKKSQDTLWE